MSTDAADRLAQQIAFILEINRLKGVIRRTHLPHVDRRENTAEHSWQFALAALVLAEHANEKVDVARAVFMALVHDLVEIDAGDTFVYDRQALEGKLERERIAAERIFGLLPAEQAERLRTLWEEFEAQETPEAKFANAIDRLLPVLNNYHTQGRLWQEHQIVRSQVYEINGSIETGSTAIWSVVCELIEDAVKRGYLAAGTTSDAES